MQGLGLNTCAARGTATPFSRPGTDHLPRPRLVESLIGRKRLRLLCAPAGYGKTAVLGEFLEHAAQGEKQVWIDYAGQSKGLAWLCAGIAPALGLSPQTSPQALLRSLGARTVPLWLVLDDLGSDNPDALNEWIEQLLALRSTSVQLLVSCRQRPDWHLPRLMLEGELLELGTAQLAFTRDEFERLVDQVRFRAQGRSRDVLWEQTQGWCAGVRLLLSSPVDSVLSEHCKAGLRSPPLLREYLHYEVLARLDADEREVLLGIAHLSKASAPLCDRLWEEQRGGRLFQRLLRRHTFLIPIEHHPGWYGLLPIVARALQDQMGTTSLNRLRLRACQQLSSFGHFDDAIEQALSADQPEVAATYMEQLRLTWLLNDRHLDRLMAWRDRLPPYLLESSPRLIYLCARALMFSGRLDEAEDCLQRLRQFLPFPHAEQNQRLLANWQALYGSLQALRGEMGEARQHCQMAYDSLGAQDWLSVLLCLSTLGRVAMIEADLPEAGRRLEEAVELARRQGNRDAEVLINTDRIRLKILKGQLGLAQAMLDNDLEYLASQGEPLNPLLGRLLFIRGELLLLRGLEDEAAQVLQTGLTQVRECSAPFILFGYLLLSEVATRRQRYEDAHLLLHEAERRMHWGKIHVACYRNAIAVQNARVLAHEQQWQRVLPLTQAVELNAQACPLLMPSLGRRNQLLLARAEFATGEMEPSARRLRSLLADCEREGFTTLAQEARQLLTCMGGHPDLPGEVGAASGAEQSLPPPRSGSSNVPSYQDELTPREIAVLRLLAEGMSIREVGKSLFISENTVKTHAKNINVKLGACRRTQAINSAKTMGILA